MAEEDYGLSAFSMWEPGSRCHTLGRPVSRVVDVTVGLDGLLSAVRSGISRNVSEAEGLFDDDGGFLVLPSSAGRAKPVLLGGRYRVVRLLGTGTFAQTVEAEDFMLPHVPRARVAIKIVRSGMESIGEREAELLHLMRKSPGFPSANIVHAHSVFRVLSHECIVMELLSQPLPHFLRSVRPFSLPMSVMQKLSMQLTVALTFLSAKGVIHADIRPENVLVCLNRSPDSDGLKVKLADFGNGMLDGHAAFECEGGEVQTLPYRAPEVILGLPITSKIDMWSLGCLLLEVYMGRRLLNPYNTSSALSTMTRTLGPLSEEMLCGAVPECGGDGIGEGIKGSISKETRWKAPELVLRAKVAKLLDCGGQDSGEGWGPGGSGKRLMASLFAGCLAYHPSERLSPLQALQHPFLAALSPVPFLCPRQQDVSVSSSLSSSRRAATSIQHKIFSPGHFSDRNQNRDDSEAALLPERAPPSVPFPQSSCAFAECSAPWFVSPAHRPVARRGMADQDDDDDGNEGKLSAEARSVATCKRGGRVETHGHDDVDREDDGSRGSLMGQGEGEELRSDDEVRGSRGNAGKKFRQNLGQESSDANEKEHRRQTSRRGVISQLEWGAAGGQQDAGRLVGVRKRDWASVSGVKIEKKRGAEGVTCGSEKGIRGNCARISIVNKKSQGAVDRGKGKTGKLCNDTRTSAVKKEEEYIQARGKVKVGELCIAVRSSKEGRSDSVLDERGDFGTCFERRDMDDAFDDEITFAASQGKRRRHVLRKPEDIETSQDEHDDMKHPTLRGDLQIVRRALVKVEHQISSGAPFAEDAFGHEHQVAVRVLETGALQGGRNGETAGHAKEQHTLLSVHPEKVASEEYWKRQNAKAAEGISHTHLAEKGQGFARQAARSRRDPDVMVRSILGDDCDRVRHKHKEREDDLRTVLFQSPEMISRQEVRKQKEKKEVEAVKAQREAQHLEEQKQKGRREMKRDRYEQEAETLILHEEATRMKQQVQEMREQEDGQIEIERFVQQQEEKEEEAERIKQPEKETKRLKRQTKEGQEADLLGQQEKESQHSKQQESGANQHVKQQDSDDALAGRRQRTNKKITEWWVAS